MNVVILLCCFSSWNLVSPYAPYKSRRKQIIGLYSSCTAINSLVEKTGTINRSSLIQDAGNEVIHKWDHYDSEYIDIDVCLNKTEVTRVVVEILLNQTFRSKDNDGRIRKESDVFSIVAFVTQELFKLLTELLSFTQITTVVANKDINLSSFRVYHLSLIHI